MRVASALSRLFPVWFSVGVAAQCVTQWQAGDRVPGVTRSGLIEVVRFWDPDRSGPLPPVLVLGGTFSIPSVGARNLAMWEPATNRFSAFASQPDGAVSAIGALANGDLVIGGMFNNVGRHAARGVAVFDGTAWSCPGGGVVGPFPTAPRVTAVLGLANGDLVVGGPFTSAGAVTAGLARWDGTAWRPFGSFAGEAWALLQRPNGNVLVLGLFQVPGVAGSANIGEWNGTSWRGFGSGIPGFWTVWLRWTMLANGDLVVGGQFQQAGGVPVNNVARWDGSRWWDHSSGLPFIPSRLFVDANGDLVAAGASIGAAGVWRWVGQQWVQLAPWPGDPADCIELPGGDLLAVGGHGNPGQMVVGSMVRWDGTAWRRLGDGFDGTVRGVLPLPSGDLLAFGEFRSVAGRAVVLPQQRQQQGWVDAVGWPPTDGMPVVSYLDLSGLPWVIANGTNGQRALRWTGTGWQPFGGGSSSVSAMAIGTNGQLFIGHSSWSFTGSVETWNGTGWTRMGLDGPVHALLVRRNGNLVAGGEFLFAGTTSVARIAQWNGTTWQPFGDGFDGPVRALAELPTGELIAAGDFIMDGPGVRSLNLIASWDGAAWQPFGPGLAGDPGTSVRALLALPDGDLLAGGDFRTAGGVPAPGVARWNGTAWQPVDGSIAGTVLGLARTAGGDVVACGDFHDVGARVSAHVATLRSSCPATVTSYGAGCPGSAGVPTLVSGELPWVGAMWRSSCSNLGPTALCAQVFGLQAGQSSLAALHPAAPPECVWLASLDAVVLRVPAAGRVETEVRLPRDPTLAGVRMNQQMLVGEFSGGGTMTSLVSSNALALAVGVF